MQDAVLSSLIGVEEGKDTDKIQFIARGMTNLRNLCYANSVLQAMLGLNQWQSLLNITMNDKEGVKRKAMLQHKLTMLCALSEIFYECKSKEVQKKIIPLKPTSNTTTNTSSSSFVGNIHPSQINTRVATGESRAARKRRLKEEREAEEKRKAEEEANEKYIDMNILLEGVDMTGMNSKERKKLKRKLKLQALEKINNNNNENDNKNDNRNNNKHKEIVLPKDTIIIRSFLYNKPLTPELSPIIDKFSQFRSTQMHDAHEFFAFLLDSMHSELSKAITDNNNDKDDDNNNDNDDDDGWTEVVSPERKRTTIISDLNMIQSPISILFSGRMNIMLKKTGYKNTISYEPYFSLLLDIYGRNNILQCIDNMSIPRKIDGLKSDDSQRDINAAHITTLDTIPDILCLTLKRFDMINIQYTNDGQPIYPKIQRHVSFPLELVLPETSISNDSIKQIKQIYELRSVIVHHGINLNSGHYTCYSKREVPDHVISPYDDDNRKCWVHFDDSKIQLVQENDVLASQAYMLFYEKK